MNEKPLFILTSVIPRAGLREEVIATVAQRQRLSRLWRVRVSVSAGIAAIVGLVPVGISLAQAFAVSHFGTYLSLVFSDTSVVMSSWKAIGASLLESLPVAMMAIALALVGIALGSFRTYAQSAGSFITSNA